MALPLYLAMTAAETEGWDTLPDHLAWMACHFSSYGLGLSNIPRQLPQGSLLILNDRTPVQEHDPELVAQQLAEAVENLTAEGVLLDLQRPVTPQATAIVRSVVQALPCPVAVTECYAEELNCPVFLEAPRAYHTLEACIRKWDRRELWLEASFSPGIVTVTKAGSRYTPHSHFPEDLPIHIDEKLHCSYCIRKTDDAVQFHFRRTQDDLAALLEKAEKLGITHAIGLYQELGAFYDRISSNSNLLRSLE